MQGKDRFIKTVLGHIVDISQGDCKISDEIIKHETDPNLRDVLTGLLYLFEDLELSQQELLELNKNLESKVRDRTEQLEMVIEEIEDMTYITTHDLKSPINNLESLHSMLTSEIKPSPEKTAKIYDWMKVSIDRSKQNITALETVAEYRSLDEKPEEFDLAELILEVISSCKNLYTEARPELIINIEETPTIVYGSIAFKSILQNLLTNAFKYRSKERKLIVSINSYLTNDFVVMEIQDNGLGIDLNNSENKHFGMFRRIHVEAEGSGLGLYLIKRLIERNGGRIEVESELNKGSLFRVYLKK